MAVEPDIAAAAALFSDPVRARMLMALLDRSIMSAGELAFIANASPQSASFHLAKLSSAELITGERRGRHQMYRLAGPAVALAIESLAAVSVKRTATHTQHDDRFRSERMRQLRAARTCYDHLAGVLGVHVHDSLFRAGYLRCAEAKNYELTKKGHGWLRGLGWEFVGVKSPVVRRCIDWSERRPHLAGRLAARMLEKFLADRWIVRNRDTRAVRITEKGVCEFEKQYGFTLTRSQI